MCFCVCFLSQVSDKFAFSLFDLDWDVFMQHIEGAVNRVPKLEETGIKSTVCGPGTCTHAHQHINNNSAGKQTHLITLCITSGNKQLS